MTLVSLTYRGNFGNSVCIFENRGVRFEESNLSSGLSSIVSTFHSMLNKLEAGSTVSRLGSSYGGMLMISSIVRFDFLKLASSGVRYS